MATATKTKSAETRKTAGIGDEAVRKATGRTWPEWCRLLDKDGCRKLDHKAIARLVHEKHGVGPWWSQMVTVGYEQARGLRKVHETPRGWQTSVSRTINVPLSRLYAAWDDAAARKSWLGARPVSIRKATRNKSIRITSEKDTSLEVNFYSKGPGKSQVTVQHGKLRSAADVARSKKQWGAALDRLKKMLLQDRDHAGRCIRCTCC